MYKRKIFTLIELFGCDCDYCSSVVNYFSLHRDQQKSCKIDNLHIPSTTDYVGAACLSDIQQ